MFYFYLAIIFSIISILIIYQTYNNNFYKMLYCYPAIILSIISIYIIYLTYNTGLYWAAGPMFALPFIVFAIISFVLCKKGYNKIAWTMILGAFICHIMIWTGIIPIHLITELQYLFH